MNMPRGQTGHVLVCLECCAVTGDGTGWKAMLTVGDEDAEEVEEAAVYCPECAAMEFGWP